MSNEVVEKKSYPIEKYWSLDQAKIIKNTIAPDLTADEFVVFAHICTKVNLDPLAKQIYAIKRAGKLCIQTGIDGFRLVAERTGKYSPGKDTEFLYDDKGALIGAKVYVKKMTPDGTWHDVSATAFLKEYSSGKGLWATLPHVMIEKAAESRCLRRCFPADLSGLYTDDEMDQSEVKVEKIEPVIESITSAQHEELEKYLEGNVDLRKNILSFLTSKYNVTHLSQMPKELFGHAVKTAKEAYQKMDDEVQEVSA